MNISQIKAAAREAGATPENPALLVNDCDCGMPHRGPNSMAGLAAFARVGVERVANVHAATPAPPLVSSSPAVDQAIGASVRRARREAGVSQAALAEALGLPHQTAISKIESGERALLAREVLPMARALNVSMLSLLEAGR